MLITLEGPDGSGKTTQVARLVDQLRARGIDVVPVHEPGGTELGADIRALLVRRGRRSIDPWAEALLFSACRAQLMAEVIRPALERGAVVVADRFGDSTLAYQGAGRDLPTRHLELLVQLATGGLQPDLTLLLDVPGSVGLSRLNRFGKAPGRSTAQISFFEELQLPEGWNRFEDEGVAFQERVRSAYLKLAQAEPGRWVILDATGSVDQVAAAVWETVEARLRAGG